MNKRSFQFGSKDATAKPERPFLEPTAQPGSDVVFGLRRQGLGPTPSKLYARTMAPVFHVVERRKSDLTQTGTRTFGKRTSGIRISRMNARFGRRKTDKLKY